MKVAITGGTGFVGGHLARALAAGGHRIVTVARGIDRTSRDGLPEKVLRPGRSGFFVRRKICATTR